MAIFALGIRQGDVLDRIRRGLLEVGSPINAREAGWVVGRLAEVLAWPWLNTAEKPPADA